MRDGNKAREETFMSDIAYEERHVFRDKDAEVIHQALMLLVGGIRDLQEIVERVHEEIVSQRDA
jgi:hypothetical protein